LILAAVAQFLFGENAFQNDEAKALTLFQKALKYGLPDRLAISCFEGGFADREISQRLCNVVRTDGYTGELFEDALTAHRATIEATLEAYPTYFKSVPDGRA
jgi:hypothetical protein